MAGTVSGLTSALSQMNGWLAIGLITALVFGETAIFLGFVLPGEAAVVLGGVLASRGRLSIWSLAFVVVIAAVTGPLVGYEIGKRMGDKLFDSRALRRVPGAVRRARSTLRDKGGLAVFGGRFVAVLRALMPAAAGAARMPYRRFVFHNVVGGLIWGVGYSLLGYVAGSAYGVVERRVGAGLAIAVTTVILALVAVWAWRRRRSVLVQGGAVLPGDPPDADGLEPPAALGLGRAMLSGAPSSGDASDLDGLAPGGLDPGGQEPAG